jgi:hypothetical protein
MVVHSLKPGPAGPVLRTTGEPRRGRCKKRTGADGTLSLQAFACATPRLAIFISSSPAPRRFAPPAAPLSSIRLADASGPSLGCRSLSGTSRARPSSAHAPGRSSVVFLSVLVEPTTIVTSKNASAAARCARRGFPGRPTHALRRPLTCHRARFTTVAGPHNQRLQLTRFATLACS